MKYLGLAYYDPERLAALTPEQLKALVSQCPALDAQMRATGQVRMSASLAEPKDWMSLRPRGGKPVVSDGPFTESKELVGGLFIIEAADRDEALRLATLHPAASLGEAVGWGVELIPIGSFVTLQDEAPDGAR